MATIWMTALRRYWLATCCVVGPILLVYGSDIAVQALIPNDKIGSIGFDYKLRDTDPPSPTAPDPQDSKPEAGDSAKARGNVAPDPKMELYARHIAGRFNFAVTNGFMYLLAAASLVFGLAVSYHRGGLRFTAATAVLACGASALGQRFRGSNHIRRPRRACRTKCG
jgi:hypothetical protein